MNTRSSKEYQYIFTTTCKQASTSHFSSWLTTWAASSWLSLSYLIFSYLISSCCQFPFCEFTKHTTPLHYRYDMQMYCTFVLFVNQHFPGLPASGTHCIISRPAILDLAIKRKVPVTDGNQTPVVKLSSAQIAGTIIIFLVLTPCTGIFMMSLEAKDSYFGQHQDCLMIIFRQPTLHISSGHH
jgi:hypothetical protein